MKERTNECNAALDRKLLFCYRVAWLRGDPLAEKQISSHVYITNAFSQYFMKDIKNDYIFS